MTRPIRMLVCAIAVSFVAVAGSARLAAEGVTPRYRFFHGIVDTTIGLTPTQDSGDGYGRVSIKWDDNAAALLFTSKQPFTVRSEINFIPGVYSYPNEQLTISDGHFSFWVGNTMFDFNLPMTVAPDGGYQAGETADTYHVFGIKASLYGVPNVPEPGSLTLLGTVILFAGLVGTCGRKRYGG
jgi:hypothetical protein